MDSSEQEDPEKPPKLHVKKMREQIRQLEDRKRKFKKKLDGLTQETAIQEQEIKVLEKKVAAEVKELNDIHHLIMLQEERIRRLNEVKERNQHYAKIVSGQSRFNPQLSQEHRAKTNNMKGAIDKGGDGEAEDNEGEHQIKYEMDPVCVQILKDVQAFRLG